MPLIYKNILETNNKIMAKGELTTPKEEQGKYTNNWEKTIRKKKTAEVLLIGLFYLSKGPTSRADNLLVGQLN